MTIGDQIEKFHGPLSDIVFNPIKMVHVLSYGRELKLELTFDVGFVLKIDGLGFDQMLVAPSQGTEPVGGLRRELETTDDAGATCERTEFRLRLD